MTKAFERGCPDCERGWVEAGNAWRPCERCRPEDFAHWRELNGAEQLELRPPHERPALPERRDLE